MAEKIGKNEIPPTALPTELSVGGAESELHAGKPEKALGAAYQILESATEFGKPHTKARAEHVIGRALKSLGQRRKAMAFFQLSDLSFQQIERREPTDKVHLNHAKVERDIGLLSAELIKDRVAGAKDLTYDDARAHITDSLDLLDRVQNPTLPKVELERTVTSSFLHRIELLESGPNNAVVNDLWQDASNIHDRRIDAHGHWNPEDMIYESDARMAATHAEFRMKRLLLSLPRTAFTAIASGNLKQAALELPFTVVGRAASNTLERL